MKFFSTFLVLGMCLINLPAFSQTENDDTPLLNLPGDNLDLYAVLTLFQKSKTIEAFEKSLNEEQTKINNLDLNLDNKVDFIKVETTQKDQDFTFILQVDVNEKEKQDVAVILVSKDKNGKVVMQIVGDEDLYGKDYVIEPQPAATPNPGYTGTQPAIPAAATAPTIIIESAPVVQYVYSPVYVPYYPPYHYAFYPPYFAAFTVMAIGIYHHNNYYYHAGYHGGYGHHTVVVHHSHYNSYHSTRHTSTTVSHHNTSGSYRSSNNSSVNNRASTNNLSSNRASTNNLSNNRATTNSRATTNNRATTNTRASTPSARSGGGRSMSGGNRSGGGRRR